MKRPEWGMPPDFLEKDLEGKDIKIGAWTVEGGAIGIRLTENIIVRK